MPNTALPYINVPMEIRLANIQDISSLLELYSMAYKGTYPDSTFTKVDNLIAIIDLNHQQIDGSTDEVMNNRDLKAKYKAFGWRVMEIANGNDMEEVVKGLRKAKRISGKGQPIMIIMHTEMGAGVDFMMGSHKWHGIAPNDEQLAAALAQLPETIGDY